MINDADLQKIEQFTGSLNFEKQAGRLDLTSSLSATLDPERRLQLSGQGVLKLTAVDVLYAALGGIAVSQAEAPFKGDFTLGPGAIQVAGTLGVNAGQSALAVADGPALGFQSLSLPPTQMSVSRAKDGAIAFDAKPRLHLQKASITSRALRLAARDIAIDLSGMKLARKRDELSLSLAGSTRANAVSAALDTVSSQPQLKLDALAMDSGQITFADTSGGRRIAGALGLELTKAEANWQEQQPPGAPLPKGSLARFRLDLSELAVDQAEGGVTVGAKGTAMLADAALTSSMLDPYLGDWLRIGELRTTLKDVAVRTAQQTTWTTHFDAVMRDFGAGAVKGAPQLRTAAVYLNEMQIDNRGRIGADAIVLDKPEADITTAWIESLMAGGRLEKDVDRVADEVSTFRLQQFSVLDAWRLGLSDYKVKPPAYFTLKLDSVDLADLDTGKPQQRSRVAIRGTLNEFTQLQSGGWASPFAPKPSFDLFGTVRRLQLPTLSPYAVRAAGVNLDSGNLRADATAKADAGRLEGVIDINVGDLSLSSPSSRNDSTSIVGVPLDTVIGLLQDSDGRIRLTVPFSGDLTAPAFDFGNAIDKALRGAFEAAVTAPFRLAYLPVDLIVRMAESGPPEIKPIPFAAGVAEIGPEGERFVEAIALVLGQRPNLRLRVCGRATREDLQARLDKEGFSAGKFVPPAVRERVEGELASLAYDRTLAVRSALIREHGISGRQVQECRASYDAGDSGPPRVEIEL